MRPKLPASRAFWLRQMRQWHWISAAVSLIGMLVFAVTGITLNHASRIESKPQVHVIDQTLPPELMQEIKLGPTSGKAHLPRALVDFVRARMSIHVTGQDAEWSAQEIYLSLPRPGGDAWLSIDRASGETRYERTDRGWIAYLNDLHKGRHTGFAWSLFLDVFAGACVVFCITGLVLLQLMANGRPSTWPLVGLGLVIPALIAIFLIH